MARASGKESPPETRPTREIVGVTGFEDEDPKNVRWAFAIAVALHALLFSLHLPGMSLRAEPPDSRRPIVVRSCPRFKPPPPDQQQVLPQRLPRRVPIPDPTPEGPELLEPAAEIEVPVALPLGDVVFGIPTAPPPVEPKAPLRVGGEVKPPVKVYAPAPGYPELARRGRIEGTVILEAVIDADGFVDRAEVLKSAPMGLDQAAIEAVTSWRFEPATLRGRPVPVVYYLTVKFELK